MAKTTFAKLATEDDVIVGDEEQVNDGGYILELNEHMADHNDLMSTLNNIDEHNSGVDDALSAIANTSIANDTANEAINDEDKLVTQEQVTEAVEALNTSMISLGYASYNVNMSNDDLGTDPRKMLMLATEDMNTFVNNTITKIKAIFDKVIDFIRHLVAKTIMYALQLNKRVKKLINHVKNSDATMPETISEPDVKRITNCIGLGISFHGNKLTDSDFDNTLKEYIIYLTDVQPEFMLMRGFVDGLHYCVAEINRDSVVDVHDAYKPVVDSLKNMHSTPSAYYSKLFWEDGGITVPPEKKSMYDFTSSLLGSKYKAIISFDKHFINAIELETPSILDWNKKSKNRALRVVIDRYAHSLSKELDIAEVKPISKEKLLHGLEALDTATVKIKEYVNEIFNATDNARKEAVKALTGLKKEDRVTTLLSYNCAHISNSLTSSKIRGMLTGLSDCITVCNTYAKYFKPLDNKPISTSHQLTH